MPHEKMPLLSDQSQSEQQERALTRSQALQSWLSQSRLVGRPLSELLAIPGAVEILVSEPPQLPLPKRLPQNLEQLGFERLYGMLRSVFSRGVPRFIPSVDIPRSRIEQYNLPGYVPGMEKVMAGDIRHFYTFGHPPKYWGGGVTQPPLLYQPQFGPPPK